jgi:hypothetical protein
MKALQRLQKVQAAHHLVDFSDAPDKSMADQVFLGYLTHVFEVSGKEVPVPTAEVGRLKSGVPSPAECHLWGRADFHGREALVLRFDRPLS